MEQQTDAEVKDEETSEEKIETNEKTKVGRRILVDIKHLKGSKLGKASQILDEILKSEYFSFDTNRRILIEESGTELLPADFLHDLQQPTKKLTLDHFRVLTLLDISGHLTANTYAKEFLLLSPE